MTRPIVKVAFASAVLLAVSGACDAQAGMLTSIGQYADLTIPDSPALVPSTGYTVEAWFYYDPAGPGGYTSPTILRKNTDSPPSYLLRLTSVNGGYPQFYANGNGGYTSVTGPSPAPILSWHHMAGTHDGLVARLFLDGVQIASQPCVGNPFFITGNLEIAKGDPAAESWHGSLDEVRLWSVAKTAAEIQASMFYERDNVPNLVAAWHFNGNYLDLTGNHHGQSNGQVTIQPSTSPVIGEEITAPPLSPIGTPLVFTIKSAFPTLPYIAEVSLTGNSPGIYIPPPINKTFPLNQPFLNYELGSFYPQVFSGFLGFIGANGTANVTLNVPVLPALIGSPIWGSYILLDPAYPLGLRVVGNGTTTVLTGPAPTVTSVTPLTSPAAGGAALTIHGSNFIQGATVTVGTSPATNVVVVDGQTLTCTSPPQPIGSKTVTVTNPDTTHGSLANGITYVANLVIGGISPITAAPGALVTITGGGFVAGTTLMVGAAPVVPSTLNATTITWTVPTGVPCEASVQLTNPDGQTQNVVWNTSPNVTSAIGASGAAAGGGTFFLVGANFHPGTTVTVGGANATILLLAPTNMFLQAPAGSPGAAPVVVTTLGGCSDTDTYIYY